MREFNNKKIYLAIILSCIMLLASVAIAGCGKKRKPNDSLNATVETALYDEGLLLIERMKKDGKSQKEITLRYETNLSRLQK